MTVQEYEGFYTTCDTSVGTPYANTTYVYDSLGNLVSLTDAKGNVSTMQYDTLSRKIIMHDPDMGDWTYAYDTADNLTHQVDAKGQHIYFQYDALGRRLQKDYGTQKALGSGDVVYTYDGSAFNRTGRLQQVQDSSGTTTFYYDVLGQVTATDKTVDGTTYTTVTSYDVLGRVLNLTYPDNSTVTHSYNGPQLAQISEGGTTYAVYGAFNAQGQPSTLTKGNGVTTTFTYDPHTYRLKTLKTVEGSTVLQDLAYTFDAGGNVATFVNGIPGHQSAGALAGPDWAIQGEGDTNGDGKADLVWRNTSTGATAVWLMDGSTKIGEGFPGGGGLNWTIKHVGDVDGDGKADLIWREAQGLVAIWLMDGTTKRSVGVPGGAGVNWTIKDVDDVDGDGKADLIWREAQGAVAIWLMNGVTLKEVGVPSGAGTNWTITGVGDTDGDGKADLIWREATTGTVAIWRMKGLTLGSVRVLGRVGTNWTIQAVGDTDGDRKADLVWREATTGYVTIWRMNGFTAVSNSGPGGMGVENVLKGVGDTDGDGKADLIWRETTTGMVSVWLMDGHSLKATGRFDPAGINYGYDALDRLTSASGPYGNLTYRYDELGNLLSNSRVGTYAYSASGPNSVRPHAVSSTDNGSGIITPYAYDANGNMASGAGRTISYDVENRPVTVTLNGTTTTMVYDGDGGRVKKTVDDGSNITTTTYIGKLYVCEGTAPTQSCARLIFSGDQRIAMKQVDTGKVSYFHADHLGSTSVLTNANGAIEEDLVYYPFGETFINTGSADVAYKYTGKERDGSTVLYFYEARYYDAVLGRFISADRLVPNPLNPQDFNRYTYVRNNPLLYVDPNGESPTAFFGAGVGLVSGAFGAAAQTNNVFGIAGGAIVGGVVGLFVGAINPVAAHEVATVTGAATASLIAAGSNIAGQYVGNLAGLASENFENGQPLSESLQAEDFQTSLRFDLATTAGAVVGAAGVSYVGAITTRFIASRFSGLFGTKFISAVGGEVTADITVGSLSTYFGGQAFSSFLPIVDFSNGFPPQIIIRGYQGPTEPIFLTNPPFTLGQSFGFSHQLLGFNLDLNVLRFSDLFNFNQNFNLNFTPPNLSFNSESNLSF